jgi:hypothetical protein
VKYLVICGFLWRARGRFNGMRAWETDTSVAVDRNAKISAISSSISPTQVLAPAMVAF